MLVVSDQEKLLSLLESEQPLNWVVTGDSITHGLRHTQGERSYFEHLHELVRCDLGRLQDILVNTAVSGWRTELLLSDFDRRVAKWEPHIVTLMIGTNDCTTEGIKFQPISPNEFAALVSEFVHRVRAIDAIPVLQTPPPVDSSHAPERARLPEFVNAMREVSLAEDVMLADHFANFSSLGASRKDGIHWGMVHDPFHPNGIGHAAITVQLAETLGLVPEVEQDRLLPYLRARVAHR